jgi:flavin-dependent dehydrogenase
VVTEVPADEKEIEEKLGRAVELHFGAIGGGYGWIFPHKTYYSVGIGGVIKDLPHPKETMLEFLKATASQVSINFTGTKSPGAELSERFPVRGSS